MIKNEKGWKMRCWKYFLWLNTNNHNGNQYLVTNIYRMYNYFLYFLKFLFRQQFAVAIDESGSGCGCGVCHGYCHLCREVK